MLPSRNKLLFCAIYSIYNLLIFIKFHIFGTNFLLINYLLFISNIQLHYKSTVKMHANLILTNYVLALVYMLYIYLIYVLAALESYQYIISRFAYSK